MTQDPLPEQPINAESEETPTESSPASSEIPSQDTDSQTDTSQSPAEPVTVLQSEHQTVFSTKSQPVGELPTVAETEPSPLTLSELVETEPVEVAVQQPAAQPDKAENQTLQTLQKFWQETQPKLKAGTIAALKVTIRVLQWSVERLEAKPRSPAPETPATQIPSATEQPAQQLTLPLTVNASWWQKLSVGWQRLRTWWSVVLPKIRTILPESINQRFSDSALTGAIAGILVLLLWTSSSLLSSKPPKQIATKSPPQATPAAKQPVPKRIPSPITSPSLPAPTASSPAAPTPATTPSPVSQPTVHSPTAEAAKPIPKPEISPSPKPSPPPLKLTPEQALIARIQDEVAEISDRYASGLIQSVQANFRSSRLTVKLGDGWYTLEDTQQDKLSNEMLKRAQQLDFIKLEITDPEGTLLARSPVVGSDMVIIQRKTSGNEQAAEDHPVSSL